MDPQSTTKKEVNPALQELIKQYKATKAAQAAAKAKAEAAANPQIEQLSSFDIVSRWLGSVDITDDNEAVTEADIFPADTASMNSTNYYRQEPFRKYQPKLFTLLGGILPLDITVTTIGRMKGGGNNRTASIGLDWPAGRELKVNGNVVFEARATDSQVRAVFRSSRWPVPNGHDIDIMDNYAVLTFLDACNLRVPTVLAYDSTSNNSLSVPYMLLLRIPGIRLEEIYPSLTVKQKERVAFLVASELVKYDEVKCSNIGTLEGGRHCIPRSVIFNEERPPTFRLQITHFITGRRQHLPVKNTTSVYAMIKNMFDNWLQIAKTAGDSLSKVTQEAYIVCFQQLLEVLDTMNARGYFDDIGDLNIALHHPDFYPRNIIIGASCRRPDNLDFEVEGVLDWDGALILPECLRATPCAWLWEWDGPQVTAVPDWDEWYGDSDILPNGRFDYRLNPDERKIKEKFDSTVGEQRVKLMYQLEYIWIRRLWKFAYGGVELKSADDMKKFEKFIEHWGKFAEKTNDLYDDPKAKGRTTGMLKNVKLERVRKFHQQPQVKPNALPPSSSSPVPYANAQHPRYATPAVYTNAQHPRFATPATDLSELSDLSLE
ncbi:hypothetical protein Dda_8994 [Drechslerella dactyloides]|uniref:Aminoglycoside phosphotransferase domain-containing protein n=1 Tax=Drechslerella dactyloides TaxID=74499 RepID=A0AAD6IQU0_DREDA|nr:hypothetical protein Dda_8994 [Drechslerella dactyloides]